jgi:hypothetical protein
MLAACSKRHLPTDEGPSGAGAGSTSLFRPQLQRAAVDFCKARRRPRQNRRRASDRALVLAGAD